MKNANEQRRKGYVIGFGVSGDAAIKLSQKVGLDLKQVDDKDDVEICAEDLVVVSPGVPPSSKLYSAAMRVGAEIISEVELALRYAGEKRFIGITGTNGKTTATLKCAYGLNQAGVKAIACGNVGRPLCDAISEEADVYVVELSSYQLEKTFSKKFEIGAILNITPDHLDRYGSFEEYRDAKIRLKELTVGKCFDGEIPLDALGLREEHFKGFVRPPHRLEVCKKVGDVTFINDSKSTNVESTIYAVNQLEGPIYLIAGGVDKGLDYTPWIEPFKEKVKGIFLIGEAAWKMGALLSPHYITYMCDTLENALTQANSLTTKGIILLSPGSSSFDQFKNYEDRGNSFKKLISLL